MILSVVGKDTDRAFRGKVDKVLWPSGLFSRRVAVRALSVPSVIRKSRARP
jgi:hypothetical protein